jgi:hypothetical protein
VDHPGLSLTTVVLLIDLAFLVVYFGQLALVFDRGD